MAMKESKAIEVYFKPSDFKGNEYIDNMNCPVAKACRRHFKTMFAQVTPYHVRLSAKEMFTIKNNFSPCDYDYVKEQITKNPNKYRWYVTLIQCNEMPYSSKGNM